MSVRLNKKNGRYTIDYYPNGRKGGRKVFDLAPGTTLERAREIHTNLLRARKKRKMVMVPTSGSIARLVPHYIKFCYTNQSEETAYDKESHLKKYIVPFFGHCRIEDLTGPLITLYKEEIKKTGFIQKKNSTEKIPISNRTISKGLSYFSGFLSWAEEELNIRPDQPLRIRKLPHTRPVPIVLSLDEAMAFIKAADPLCLNATRCAGRRYPTCHYRVPYNIMFKTFFYLGLRNRAVRHLLWEDVDWTRRGVKTREKGNKVKWHPLPDDLYDELKSIHSRSASPWIFPSPRDPRKPVNNILKAVARAKKAANITKRVYPHLLRHSIATHLLDNDVDIRQIQGFLDHAQISTTEWYTQVSLEKKRQALEKAGIKTTKM